MHHLRKLFLTLRRICTDNEIETTPINEKENKKKLILDTCQKNGFFF